MTRKEKLIRNYITIDHSHQKWEKWSKSKKVQKVHNKNKGVLNGGKKRAKRRSRENKLGKGDDKQINVAGVS